MSLLFKPLLIEFYLLAGESIPTAKPLSKKKSTGFMTPPMVRRSVVSPHPIGSQGFHPHLFSVHFHLTASLFFLGESDSSSFKKDTLRRGNTKAGSSWPKFHSAPPKALH